MMNDEDRKNRAWDVVKLVLKHAYKYRDPPDVNDAWLSAVVDDAYFVVDRFEAAGKEPEYEVR